MAPARNTSLSVPLRPNPPPSEGTAAECAANACLLCVCCPLALAWRCLELPFRLTAIAARRLFCSRRRGASISCCCFCGGDRNRIGEASTSSSDYELDWRPPNPIKGR